jgi:hypothetical protein
MGEGGSIPFMGMLGELFPKAQFMITGTLIFTKVQLLLFSCANQFSLLSRLSQVCSAPSPTVRQFLLLFASTLTLGL